MKIKDKLEIFSRTAQQEAMEKYQKLMQDIESEYQAACGEAEKKALKNSEIILQTEKYKAEQSKNKDLIHASTESKKAIVAMRNKLLDALFDEVRVKLNAFVESGEYKQYLIGQIKEKTSTYNSFEVLFQSKDMKYAQEVAAATGAKITEAHEDFIGGFKVVLIEKHAIYDATFLSRFNYEYKNFNLLKSSS